MRIIGKHNDVCVFSGATKKIEDTLFLYTQRVFHFSRLSYCLADFLAIIDQSSIIRRHPVLFRVTLSVFVCYSGILPLNVLTVF